MKICENFKNKITQNKVIIQQQDVEHEKVNTTVLKMILHFLFEVMAK
jgi:hypothetical protein